MDLFWVYLFVFFLVMAAAQTQRLQQEEEENNPEIDDAEDGWEYKVLKSRHAGFKDPRGLADTLAVESAAGWMLLEKLDDKRLRLQRPVSARDHDSDLNFDPYRNSSQKTLSGPSGGAD